MTNTYRNVDTETSLLGDAPLWYDSCARLIPSTVTLSGQPIACLPNFAIVRLRRIFERLMATGYELSLPSVTRNTFCHKSEPNSLGTHIGYETQSIQPASQHEHDIPGQAQNARPGRRREIARLTTRLDYTRRDRCVTRTGDERATSPFIARPAVSCLTTVTPSFRIGMKSSFVSRARI